MVVWGTKGQKAIFLIEKGTFWYPQKKSSNFVYLEGGSALFEQNYSYCRNKWASNQQNIIFFYWILFIFLSSHNYQKSKEMQMFKSSFKTFFVVQNYNSLTKNFMTEIHKK